MKKKQETNLEGFTKLQTILQEAEFILFKNFNLLSNKANKIKPENAEEASYRQQAMDCERITRTARNTHATPAVVTEPKQFLRYLNENREVIICLRQAYLSSDDPIEKQEICGYEQTLLELCLENGFTDWDKELNIPKHPKIQKLEHRELQFSDLAYIW